MFANEYAALDGTDLAEALRCRMVTAEELRVTAIECIGSVNPFLNAVVGDILPPRPRIDGNGEFVGVPFGVKDLGCQREGVLHESGSELGRGIIPGHDTTLMNRWRGTGLDPLCRTTTPEFGLSCSTESRDTGVTRNPWDLSRSPGGSSGGSAALVAAGALPWAHANDAAGSIRTPAALSGLVGLKPTRGRIPSGPDSDEPLFGLSTEFAVTRTVRDSAALLDAVQGTEPGDRFQIAPPLAKYGNAGKVPGRRLRIAYSTRSPFGGTIDPACERITHEVAGILDGLGHDVVETEPALDPDQFIDMSVRFWSASVSETVRDLTGNRSEATVMSLLQATTAAFAHRGHTLTWHDVAQARSWQNVLTRQTSRHFASYDIQLTPTVSRPAWPVGLLKPDDPAIGPEAWMRQLFDLAPFTPLYNVTGQPAISLPMGMEGELPLGVQLAAAQGREDLLFSISFELERHMPWSHRRPKTHVLNRQQNRTEVSDA